MTPHEALSRIEQMHQQLARAESFRGYRAATTAFTGLLAFVAAMIQWEFHLNDVYSFLDLWVVIAVIGLLVVAAEMTVRCLRSDSKLQRDATLLAVSQFVPSLVAGLVLTIALGQFAPHSMGLLPALWAMIFALGIFASRPSLPPAANFVGAYYLMASVFVLATANNKMEFQVWPMPLIFGVGQLFAAAVLYFNCKRNHESQ